MTLSSAQKSKPVVFYLLLVCLIFLGLGAVGGGGALILDPNGGFLKMPLSMLKNSLFKNFLIPGLLLFLGLGVYPLIKGTALPRRRKRGMLSVLTLI